MKEIELIDYKTNSVLVDKYICELDAISSDGQFCQKAMKTQRLKRINTKQYYQFKKKMNEQIYIFNIYNNNNSKDEIEVIINNEQNKMIVGRWYKIQDKKRAFSSLWINLFWDINKQLKKEIDYEMSYEEICTINRMLKSVYVGKLNTFLSYN